MLVNSLSEKIDIPHEPGAWIQVKPLTFAARESARQKAKLRMYEEMRAVSAMAASLPDDVRKRSAEKAESAEPKERDLLAEYDADTVVDGALAAWSYDEEIGKPSEQLDAATLEWAALTILERNVRPPANGQA